MKLVEDIIKLIFTSNKKNLCPWETGQGKHNKTKLQYLWRHWERLVKI